MYLSKIQDWIALSYEVHVSKTVLHENIRDAGISFKLLRKAVAERDEDQQLEWKEDVNTHFIASQMVFVDETSKDNRTIYRHYGHTMVGHRASIIANFVREDWFSMVAALLLDGYEAVHVFEGFLDGEDFLDFIVNDVVHRVVYSTSLDSTKSSASCLQ